MKKAIIGAGGHAREVQSQMGTNLPMFVDDEFANDYILPISKIDFNEFEIMIAISDPISRKKIVENLPDNTKFFSFIHPTALLLDKETIKIGEGSFIGAYSILTTNISLGKHSLLNRGNQIGHDCIIGDYLSMMPGSIISGNCDIGDLFYCGSNSTIKEKIKIYDHIKIGMNCCVTKNLINSGTYVGVPAKKFNK